MIDHKSIINQRLDTPVGRRLEGRDSDESHQMNPLPPLPNGTSASADTPPGEWNAICLISSVNRILTLPLLQSAIGVS